MKMRLMSGSMVIGWVLIAGGGRVIADETEALASPPVVVPAGREAERQVKDQPARPAQPVLAARTSGQLTYSQTVDTDKAAGQGGGGGIVGRINEVAAAMEGAGAGESKTVTATQTLLIEGYLTEREREPWRVTLKVAEPVLQLPAELKPQVRQALERESELLVATLREWAVELSAEQVLELKLKGQTRVAVRQPFEELSRWKGSAPVLVLHRTLEAEVVGLRFMKVGPGGLREVEVLPTATPTVVEVMFNRPPDSGEHLVELKAGRGVLKLVAQRVDENPARFMTPVFVVWFEDGGLPPPDVGRGADADAGKGKEEAR